MVRGRIPAAPYVVITGAPSRCARRPTSAAGVDRSGAGPDQRALGRVDEPHGVTERSFLERHLVSDVGRLADRLLLSRSVGTWRYTGRVGVEPRGPVTASCYLLGQVLGARDGCGFAFTTGPNIAA